MLWPAPWHRGGDLLLVNLPVMLPFPRLGWFFRLNTRRGDDMDPLYNVVVVHRLAASTPPWASGSRRWC